MVKNFRLFLFQTEISKTFGIFPANNTAKKWKVQNFLSIRISGDWPKSKVEQLRDFNSKNCHTQSRQGVIRAQRGTQIVLLVGYFFSLLTGVICYVLEFGPKVANKSNNL